MASISTSVRSLMTTNSNRASVKSRIATRGSFFDQESLKFFMEKHQMKQTPKNKNWIANKNRKLECVPVLNHPAQHFK